MLIHYLMMVYKQICFVRYPIHDTHGLFNCMELLTATCTFVPFVWTQNTVEIVCQSTFNDLTSRRFTSNKEFLHDSQIIQFGDSVGIV